MTTDLIAAEQTPAEAATLLLALENAHLDAWAAAYALPLAESAQGTHRYRAAHAHAQDLDDLYTGLAQLTVALGWRGPAEDAQEFADRTGGSTVTCPYCGSPYIHREADYRDDCDPDLWHCSNCGEEWEEAPEPPMT